MSDRVIPDGTYTVTGPGGQMSMPNGPQDGVVMLGPEGDPIQQWTVAFNSGHYTLRNVATGSYLGNDGDPNQSAMMVKGTRLPFIWDFAPGPDDRAETFIFTSAASSSGLVLTLSLLRIFPPQLAILDPSGFTNVEWELTPVRGS